MSDDWADGPTLLSRRTILQASAAALAATTTLAVPAAPGLVASAEAQPATTPVPAYILKRLKQHNVAHLFGIPAATCDALFVAAEANGVKPVICSCDLEAGYAADGYARQRGLAAVSVARGVGTLSLANAIAGAYVERSPVVLINGGPSQDELTRQRRSGVLFSHSTGKLPADVISRDSSDLIVFRELTAFAARADKAADVPRIVDAAIKTALAEQRPVYIEIAKDVWGGKCQTPAGSLRPAPAPTGREDEVAGKILAALHGARRPALLLGIELARYGLGPRAAELVRALGARYATTLLAKSVIGEDTPGFSGVHDGSRAPAAVRTVIDGADALLALGCIFEAQHAEMVAKTARHLIRIADGAAWLPGSAAPVPVDLATLLERLIAQKLGDYGQRRLAAPAISVPATPIRPPTPEPGLTYDDVMAAVNGVLDASFVTMVDTTLAQYAAGQLKVAGTDAFVVNGVWQSIGFSAGAALGVALGGTRRPLVICGDGGFQEMAQGVSTLARHAVPAIVIVLDNGRYNIEQYLLAPGYFKGDAASRRPYLDLNPWNYAALARSMRAEGLPHADAPAIATPALLAAALTMAKAASGPVLIHAIVRPHDLPSEIRVA